MVELENPPENPCFACGPRHPRGLRLKFEEEVGSDGVRGLRSSFTPKEDEVGWPGILHTGLHFTLLYEVSYWTALTLGGQLMVSTGPATYAHQRLPRVGRTHVARARLGPPVGGTLPVRATTETSEGRPCGTLDTTWRAIARVELDRAGILLPEYLLSEIHS
jgi:hypothetical protein